jgi:glucose-6-phosphate 1-dehydrogenase
VGDISLMRFTNRVLEPLWNRKHIESIQIIMKEKIDVEDRGEFYDKYGALKDVVQNHAMQLLALVAMESPHKLSGEGVRNAKSQILKKIKVKDVLLGQYENFNKEKGVKRNSKTETFAAIKLSITNKRWQNVPFYIKVGKALDEKHTSIIIRFRKVDCLLSKSCPSEPNYFKIRIEPDAGFSLELNSKVPGKREEITNIKMNFCEHTKFGPNTPQAYEVLLEDVIKADQSVFVRDDEIESAWRIIDQIKKKKLKIFSYKKGTNGPKELEKFEKINKMRFLK